MAAISGTGSTAPRSPPCSARTSPARAWTPCPSRRAQLLWEYRQVHRSGAPLLLDNDPLVQSSLERVERLVLPLSSDGKAVDRLLIGAFPARISAIARQPLPERRSALRVAVRLAAVVEAGGRRSSGTVLDYSPGGARLRLDQPLPGRDPLTLTIEGGAALAARLVWEREGEAGFQFTSGEFHVPAG